MKFYKKIYISFLLPVLLTGANAFAQNQVQSIAVSNKFLRYEGRVGFDEPTVAKIYWAGSSIAIRFKGTELKAILKDERGHNYYNVIIDNDSIHMLKPATVKTAYTLASGLSEGEHTVQLFKRTDGKAGMTLFYGFELPTDTKLLDLPRKKRTIEFYGNSITVGSGISEGKFPGGDENNYLSYAAVTARHFNAGYTCIARSGIGLMVSWFSLTMAEMYSRLNPDDSASKWNFKKNIPDLVVVNLLQNDNALVGMPEDEQFKKRFGNTAPTAEYIIKTYSRFIESIRDYYPKANIVCALGNMDAVKPGSPWPGYIEKAVELLQDKKIHTYFFPYGNEEHPDVKAQQAMAEGLIQFIERTIKW